MNFKVIDPGTKYTGLLRQLAREVTVAYGRKADLTVNPPAGGHSRIRVSCDSDFIQCKARDSFSIGGDRATVTVRYFLPAPGSTRALPTANTSIDCKGSEEDTSSVCFMIKDVMSGENSPLPPETLDLADRAFAFMHHQSGPDAGEPESPLDGGVPADGGILDGADLLSIDGGASLRDASPSPADPISDGSDGPDGSDTHDPGFTVIRFKEAPKVGHTVSLDPVIPPSFSFFFSDGVTGSPWPEFGLVALLSLWLLIRSLRSKEPIPLDKIRRTEVTPPTAEAPVVSRDTALADNRKGDQVVEPDVTPFDRLFEDPPDDSGVARDEAAFAETVITIFRTQMEPKPPEHSKVEDKIRRLEGWMWRDVHHIKTGFLIANALYTLRKRLIESTTRDERERKSRQEALEGRSASWREELPSQTVEMLLLYLEAKGESDLFKRHEAARTELDAAETDLKEFLRGRPVADELAGLYRKVPVLKANDPSRKWIDAAKRATTLLKDHEEARICLDKCRLINALQAELRQRRKALEKEDAPFLDLAKGPCDP